MELTGSAAIKAYFGGNGYPVVDTRELIALRKASASDYKWLAEQAAIELGATLKSTATLNG